MPPPTLPSLRALLGASNVRKTTTTTTNRSLYKLQGGLTQNDVDVRDVVNAAIDEIDTIDQPDTITIGDVIEFANTAQNRIVALPPATGDGRGLSLEASNGVGTGAGGDLEYATGDAATTGRGGNYTVTLGNGAGGGLSGKFYVAGASAAAIGHAIADFVGLGGGGSTDSVLQVRGDGIISDPTGGYLYLAGQISTAVIVTPRPREAIGHAIAGIGITIKGQDGVLGVTTPESASGGALQIWAGDAAVGNDDANGAVVWIKGGGKANGGEYGGVWLGGLGSVARSLGNGSGTTIHNFHRTDILSASAFRVHYDGVDLPLEEPSRQLYLNSANQIKSSSWIYDENEISTSNTTITDIYSFTPDNDTVGLVEFEILAKGPSNAVLSVDAVFLWKKNGSTLTLFDLFDGSANADFFVCDEIGVLNPLNVTTAGGVLRVQVAGKAATNIDWSISIRYRSK